MSQPIAGTVLPLIYTPQLIAGTISRGIYKYIYVSLTSATTVVGAWVGCSALKAFDAIGLGSLLTDCTSAWGVTGPWVLGGTATTTRNFINYNALTGVVGWSASNPIVVV